VAVSGHPALQIGDRGFAAASTVFPLREAANETLVWFYPTEKTAAISAGRTNASCKGLPGLPARPTGRRPNR